MSALFHVKSNTVGDFTGTITGFNSTGGTQTLAATNLVRPSDWNSGHQMSGTISGNTSGQSTFSGVTNVVYQGGNNVTLALSTAASLATMHVIAAGPVTIQKWEPTPPTGTSLSSYGQNTLYIMPVRPGNPVSFSGINMVMSMSSVTSSISHSVGHTFSMGLYSRQTGASSTRIGSITTMSAFIAASYSSNLSGGYTINMDGSSTTVSSAGTVFGSVLSGLKQLAFPMSGTFAQDNEYYVGIAQSSNSVGGTGAIRMSWLVNNPLTNASMGRIFTNGISVSNATYKMDNAAFQFSSTSGAWPSTIGDNSRSIASNIRPWVLFEA